MGITRSPFSLATKRIAKPLAGDDAKLISYNHTLNRFEYVTVTLPADSFLATIEPADWVADGGRYSSVVNHSLNCNRFLFQAWEGNFAIGVDDVEKIDTNSCKVYVTDNTITIDFVIKAVL